MMFMISDLYGSNLLTLEHCHKVISDIIAHWHNMQNTTHIAIKLCNAKKMISASMFIMENIME